MARLFSGLVLAASVCVAGCYDGEQEYAEGPVVVTTKTQQVRDSLRGLAQTGVLDSGVDMLGENIEALRGEGVQNVDELKRDFEQLRSANNPAAVKKAAETMLAKLPPESAPAQPAPAP